MRMRMIMRMIMRITRVITRMIMGHVCNPWKFDPLKVLAFYKGV